jgi:hypothetical protein
MSAAAPGLETRTKIGTGVVSRSFGRLTEHPGAAKTSKDLERDAELDASPTRRSRGMRRRLKELVAIAMPEEPDAEARVLRGMRKVARVLPNTTTSLRRLLR